MSPAEVRKKSSHNISQELYKKEELGLGSSSTPSQESIQGYPDSSISFGNESIPGIPSSSSSSSEKTETETDSSKTLTEKTETESESEKEGSTSSASTSSQLSSKTISEKEITPQSIKSDTSKKSESYSEKGIKELEFQEDLQQNLISNMSPEEREKQKEFIFSAELSKKSKRQQNKFLKEKGNAERISIEHFNKEFSKLRTDIPQVKGESPPSPSPSDELESQTNENAYNFLYPTLDDPQFNIKIASKKEFADTKYDGTVHENLEKIKKHSDKMCNADFELSPHQLFVRNFLSFQTPYNSLLLYHGLGTGKTCSAITICEEMRDYLTQIGLSTSKKIIIVASPNVQENFKLQLFDKNKLKLIDGIWNIRSCTGNKFLKEINPMNMKGMEQDKVVAEIKKIIRSSYRFLGYDQFANLIEKTSSVSDDIVDKSHRTKIMMQKLKLVFGNSLIVIDEFHNIKSTDEKSGTRAVADQLEKLVRFGPFLMTRLLLLTGTPMYNSYREIIWLINIMRINDGRAEIDIRDVFNSNPDEGIFVETVEGEGRGQLS